MSPQACIALTAKCRPCRGYAAANRLCRLHQTFFEPARLFQYLLDHCDFYQTILDRERVIRTLKAVPWKSRQDGWLEKQLLAAFETPNDGWRRGQAAHLYTVLVRSEILDPYAIPALWRKEVANQLDLLRYAFPRRPQRTEKALVGYLMEMLAPFFRVRGAPTEEQVTHLLRIVLMSKQGQEQPDHQYLPLNTQEWNCVLTNLFCMIPTSDWLSVNRETLFQTLDVLEKALRPRDDSLVSSIRSQIDAAFSVAMNATVLKRANTRDEIQMLAWQPERVVDWCLDVEERRRVRADFQP